MSEFIRISEIFGPTIQGEGALIGQPTVFVRTGGCDFRCSWCDTLHAVDSEYRDTWKFKASDEVFAEVQKLSRNTPLLITLSGGNPAIQPLGNFISLGKSHGYKFALETQGSVSQDWFADLDVLTLSPKPPSSNVADTDWTKFDACLRQAKNGPEIHLKIVVFDERDYQYAMSVAERYPDLPLYLQPGNHTPPIADADDTPIDVDGIYERMRWLVERVNTDGHYHVHVLPQLHTLLWGNQKGV